MNESLFNWGEIQKLLRLSVPHILLALFVLLSFVTMPFDIKVRPYLVLMAIYYWGVYRPTLVPPWLCFVTGLVLDILGGGPLGLNALILVAVRWVVTSQRRFLMAQPYMTTWFIFGVVAAFVALFEWGAYGLASMSWASLSYPFFSFLLSLSFFPFITLILVKVHKILPQYSGALPGSAMS